MIYLDYNATTPIAPEVLEAMLPYLKEEWGNPSSSYRFGSKLRSIIERSREQVANMLGANPSEIIFTSCGTESNNAAINAALRARPDKRHIITSQVEHSAVLQHCKALEMQGYAVTYLPVDREGLLNINDLDVSISTGTALVSLMWANNETGVLFPIENIARLCNERGVLFHCDAIQAAGKIRIDLQQTPINYLSITGHKLYAAKGVGALYVRKRTPFSPYLIGGNQERGMRGGTESVAMVVGLGKASELTLQTLPKYDSQIQPLRDNLENQILSSIKGAERNGNIEKRLSNTTSINFQGIASESLIRLLDKCDICVSSGSACLADSDEPSHVISAMKPETGRLRETIRFSLGFDLKQAQVEYVVRALKDAASCLHEL